MPQSGAYPGSSEDGKDDVRHIEEVPKSDKNGDSFPATVTPPPMYTGRWERVRYALIPLSMLFLVVH